MVLSTRNQNSVLRPAGYLNYTAHVEDDVVNNAVLLWSALRRSRSTNSKVTTMALDGREELRFRRSLHNISRPFVYDTSVLAYDQLSRRALSSPVFSGLAVLRSVTLLTKRCYIRLQN